MSVIVKGMGMPKRCFDCDLYDDEERFCKAQKEFMAMAFYIDYKDKDCPLVGLPEKHGDLIDRDALKKDYKMGNDCNDCETDWKSCQYYIVYSKMDFCGWLDDAPVVIEAEDE